jgi:hypothetical protein
VPREATRPMSAPGVILGSMEAGNPAWVPGDAELEARERLLDGDLPPGAGPLLEVAAKLTVRAFVAYAAGDQETCDALLAEGLAAGGEVFTAFAEHVTSPTWLSRVDSPHWVPFLAHLAFMVLEPLPAPPAPAPQPPPSAGPVNLADELRAMGLM